MTATAITGNSALGQSISTTHDQWGLSVPVKQLAIYNSHPTQILYVKAYTGSSAATAAANSLAATAVTATTTGSSFYRIPPATRQVILKSARATFVSIDILATTGATTFDIQGQNWLD